MCESKRVFILFFLQPCCFILGIVFFVVVVFVYMLLCCRCVGLFRRLAIVVAFFRFLSLFTLGCLTKITRCMHIRVMCAYFSLSVYYDVVAAVVGAVVMVTACDAAAAAAAIFVGFVIFIMVASIVKICSYS